MSHLRLESQKEPLPSPSSLKTAYPLTPELENHIFLTRETITNILNRKDPRLLVIVGPCSIHDLSSALQYAEQLKSLSHELQDLFFIIMRVYLEKPRTRLGWKGYLHDPHLDGSNDLISGLYFSRRLLLELAQLELPVATEFLDPHSYEFYGDLISWGCVGARTVNSPIHRQIASRLPMPVGFKNTVDGNIDIALYGIQVAASPQSFMGIDEEGKLACIRTTGNHLGHLVLRGSHQGPNYDPASIERTLNTIQQLEQPQRLLVDCSHDNAFKNHEKQIPAFESVLHQIAEGNPWIRGIMLESHLNAGNQILTPDPKELKYGVSITDPCLDWDSTLKLLRIGRHFLKNA